MRKNRLFGVVIMTLMVIASSRAVRAAGYQIRFLTIVLPRAMDATDCSATGINDMGTIVGFCSGGKDKLTHGWIYNGKTFEEIEIDAAHVFPIPPQTTPPIIEKRTTSTIIPKGINNSGVISGWLGYQDYATVGELYPPTPPTLTPIRNKLASFLRLSRTNVIGIEPEHARLTEVGGLNDYGVVSGDFASDVDNRFHGFIWSRANGFTIVDAPSARNTSFADINNKNQIVGNCDPCQFSFVRDNNKFANVDISDAHDVLLRAINDHETILGSATIHDQPLTFVFNRVTSALETVTVPGATGVASFDINNRGRIVGGANFNGKNRAFVATPN